MALAKANKKVLVTYVPLGEGDLLGVIWGERTGDDIHIPVDDGVEVIVNKRGEVIGFDMYSLSKRGDVLMHLPKTQREAEKLADARFPAVSVESLVKSRKHTA